MNRFRLDYLGVCGGRVVSGAGSSSLATYGVIHISLGHIAAHVYILGI